ncbi:hypothetical protein [Komagataeibacter saccharivorans]|nr:hypothetical protein [Komagataeibacter saccharivorans]
MATKRRATAPAFCTVIFRARDPRQPAPVPPVGTAARYHPWCPVR